MSWLHTWAGVTVGAVLFAIFWMGTLAVFDAEIDRWMIPSTRLAAMNEPWSLDAAWRDRTPPAGSSAWTMVLPTDRKPTVELRFQDAEGRWTHRLIDPGSDRTLPPPGSLAGTGFIYPFHVHLHIRPFGFGYWVVGLAGMAMLALIVSGVVIHRRIFADFFLLRFRRKGQRGILDLHNVAGVAALPFHVAITLSGLVIFLSIYYPAIRFFAYAGDDRAYYSEAFGTDSYARPKQGRPGTLASLDEMAAKAQEIWGGDAVGTLSVVHPGDAGAFVQLGRSVEFAVPYNRDRVYFDGRSGSILSVYKPVPASRIQRFIAGLHFIQFRHWILRWSYFVLGLAGCVMIATGFLFWIESRRQRHAKSGLLGVRLVEGLTVGSVTGIVAATLALFIANRLLPADATLLGIGRQALELWAFCLAWLTAFGHAWLRPKRAWLEQCRALSALAATAVLLNWLTTGDHLFRSLVQPHLRAVATVDAILIGIALLAALAARKLRQRAALAPGDDVGLSLASRSAD